MYSFLDCAHRCQGNVFTPRACNNLHTDGQTRATKLYFACRLLNHIARREATNFLVRTHTGDGNDPCGVAKHIVEGHITTSQD